MQLSLFCFFASSARACRFEVTVTSVSLPPFMSHRGLFLPAPPDSLGRLLFLPPSRFRSFFLPSASSGWPRSPPCFLLALPCVCWGGGVSCGAYRAQLGRLGGSRWGFESILDDPILIQFGSGQPCCDAILKVHADMGFDCGEP